MNRRKFLSVLTGLVGFSLVPKQVDASSSLKPIHVTDWGSFKTEDYCVSCLTPIRVSLDQDTFDRVSYFGADPCDKDHYRAHVIFYADKDNLGTIRKIYKKKQVMAEVVGDHYAYHFVGTIEHFFWSVGDGLDNEDSVWKVDVVLKTDRIESQHSFEKNMRIGIYKDQKAWLGRFDE